VVSVGAQSFPSHHGGRNPRAEVRATQQALLAGCGKTLPCCHPESFAVILIPPCGPATAGSLCPVRINCAKDLALGIFMEIRDSSSSARKNGGLLRMTAPTSFSATSWGVLGCSSLTLLVPPDSWTSCQKGQRRQDRISVWAWRESTRTVYWLRDQAEDLGCVAFIFTET
jgi:hypothetical protein